MQKLPEGSDGKKGNECANKRDRPNKRRKLILFWRNFGKELVILFHQTAAAPWGHVASIIKRSSTGDSLSFGSTTNTVSTGPFRSSPLTAYLFSTFHHLGPKSNERTCWF